MFINYEYLRIIWWLLIGILLISFVITDGFDHGVAILLSFISRNEVDRRVMLETIEPIWESNQVWLILGAGAIFAAWPALYALSFSGFYLAMMLVLFALILRPVAIKFRNKSNQPIWRNTWDLILSLSGITVALVLGVAIGNVLQGVPFYFDDDLRVFYTGSFWQLFTPFTLICGLTCVAMFAMHGSLYVAIKTEFALRQRAVTAAKISSILLILFFTLGGVFIHYRINGYFVTSTLLHDAPSNPLHKQVSTALGGWLNNYALYPKLWALPLLAIMGAVLVLLFAKFSRIAFIASSLAISAIISTVGASMFPFLLPSSTHPNMSLLVWDTSSSQLTLFIMLLAAVFFIPLILFYTSWVYYVLRGKISEQHTPY